MRVSLASWTQYTLLSYLLVHVELPEDLSGVQQVLVLKDPVQCIVSACNLAKEYALLPQIAPHRLPWIITYFLAFQATRVRLRMSGTQ